MLNMNRTQFNRLQARKKLLSKKSIAIDSLSGWNTVPSFIIDAFFEDCSYIKRMHVATFCFLNGFTDDQMVETTCFQFPKSKRAENKDFLIKKSF